MLRPRTRTRTGWQDGTWQTCSLIIGWRNGRGTIRHTTAWWAVNNSSPFVPVHHPFTLVFKKIIIINPPSISSPLLNILFWFYWRLRPQLSTVSVCWGHHLAIVIFASSWQVACHRTTTMQSSGAMWEDARVAARALTAWCCIKLCGWWGVWQGTDESRGTVFATLFYRTGAVFMERG